MKYSDYIGSEISKKKGIKRFLYKVTFNFFKFFFHRIDNLQINEEGSSINYKRNTVMTGESLSVYLDLLDARKKNGKSFKLEEDNTFSYVYFPELKPNNKIYFYGSNKNYNRYVEGLYGDEGVRNWCGKKISMKFRLNTLGSKDNFKLKIYFQDIFNNVQKSEISINGYELFKEIDEKNKEIELNLNDKENECFDIILNFPNAISPEKLGISNDPRDLSVSINYLEILQIK